MEQEEEPGLIADWNDQQAAAAPPPPDWAALPRELVLEILGRLRHVDILSGAGLACASWRRAAVDEPTLWRHIDLSFDDPDGINTEAWLVRQAMGRAAVDRSAGQCESFNCPADRHMLVYLADRAPSLRSLVSLTWCLPKEFSDRVITKLPMLERIEIRYGHVLRATLVGLLEHCPRLEFVDIYECFTDAYVDLDMSRRFHDKLKFVRLPRRYDKCHCHSCSQERRLASGGQPCYCRRCVRR